MYQTLFKKLNTNDVVLTVNRRLTAFLRTEHACYLQQHTQQNVHQSPTILPLANWLQLKWQQCMAAGTGAPLLLLNSTQESVLWETIIRNSTTGRGLLNLTATIQMAQQAWQLAKQWRIDHNADFFSQTEDTQAWQTWAQEFQQVCATNQWLDTHSLIDWLITIVEQKLFPLLGKIYFVGFEEFTPQCKQLLIGLEQQGCEHEKIDYQYSTTEVHSVALADNATEIESMARWAHRIRQTHPTHTIACVVPNLAEIRNAVFDCFSKVFVPQSNLPGYSIDSPFNISAGPLLKTYPLIHTALTLLNLHEITHFETVSSLLGSSFLGFAEQELFARAKVDAHLRQRGEPNIHLRQIIVIAKQLQCHELARYLDAYCKFIAQLPTAALPSQWAKLFTDLLHLFGWPGERTLNSEEYQLSERWATLLDEFSRLDLVVDAVDKATAWQHLSQLAGKTFFQPQSPSTPIQILGVLETAGLHFDQVWVMGLHDGAWPAAPQPNAFIPLALQRQLNLPHATSERELHFCRLMTERLCHSANQVILSYPFCIEDRSLQPSSLISKASSITIDEIALSPYQSYAESIFLQRALETLDDQLAPTIADSETITGGSAIFKGQAACPFQAFARFRLGARALETPKPGLDARQRGALLHRCLEVVWNVLGNQQKLLSCTTTQLQAIVEQAVSAAVLHFIKKSPQIFKQRFTHTEKVRLQKRILIWLEIEKKRQNFTVAAIEQQQNVNVGGIPLNLRIDRIDQLDNGSHIIIDYKTGDTTVNSWFSDRPDEPQLPLYAIASEIPIDALLFAQLQSSKMKFNGISAHETGIAGVKSTFDWPELLQMWRSVLETLAQQFRAGDARVDPKKGACINCDAQILCRVPKQ